MLLARNDDDDVLEECITLVLVFLETFSSTAVIFSVAFFCSSSLYIFWQ